MSSWFETIALVVAVASVAIAGAAVVAVGLVRAVRAGRQLRWLRRDRQMRPLLLSILDGDLVSVPDRRDRLHLIGLAVRTSHNVRGTDRKVIAAWLRTAGALGVASRMLRSRSGLVRARGIELYLPIADGHARVLERLLLDRNRSVRALACEALGRAAALEAIPALLRATGSGHRQLPPALTTMAITRMMPPHAALLLDPASTCPLATRVLAIELVGILNLIDGRRSLESALADPTSDVRAAALRTLTQLGVPASEAMITAHSASTADETAALSAARAAMPASPVH